MKPSGMKLRSCSAHNQSMIFHQLTKVGSKIHSTTAGSYAIGRYLILQFRPDVSLLVHHHLELQLFITPDACEVHRGVNRRSV